MIFMFSNVFIVTSMASSEIISKLEFSLVAIGPPYNDVTIGKRLKLFTGICR